MAGTQLQYFGSRKKKRTTLTQSQLQYFGRKKKGTTRTQPQFHLFPQLPPELRCIIWRFYWAAKELPRIHHFRRWPDGRDPAENRYYARYPDRRVRGVRHDARLRMSPFKELNDAVFSGFQRLPLPAVNITDDVDFAWWDAVREPLSLETIRVTNDGTTDWLSALSLYRRPADDFGSSGQDQAQNPPQDGSLTAAVPLPIQHTRYLFLSVATDFACISAADLAALRQAMSLHTVFLVHGLHSPYAPCGRSLPHLPSFCKKNGLRILFGRYLTSAGLEKQDGWRLVGVHQKQAAARRVMDQLRVVLGDERAGAIRFEIVGDLTSWLPGGRGI
ncbi:Uu.00g050250.m01.CDS01 [Anthostomella pinea]|uniref:Uu.00g050250.m01.CDS01 n=1 Tax=Anthostomella pinea TaxID=933095 RepID=A0AAI8YML0_9PEZI|nr:Uu.00g050250.m01.CDS01 [Anthostomella pinea]